MQAFQVREAAKQQNGGKPGGEEQDWTEQRAEQGEQQ